MYEKNKSKTILLRCQYKKRKTDYVTLVDSDYFAKNSFGRINKKNLFDGPTHLNRSRLATNAVHT